MLTNHHNTAIEVANSSQADAISPEAKPLKCARIVEAVVLMTMKAALDTHELGQFCDGGEPVRMGVVRLVRNQHIGCLLSQPQPFVLEDGAAMSKRQPAPPQITTPAMPTKIIGRVVSRGLRRHPHLPAKNSAQASHPNTRHIHNPAMQVPIGQD